jgi:SAM-dependent methyltransferase
MSFGAVADDYDRLRPSPPSEAVDWLLPVRRDVVVDLAAGTGLLTRALAGKAGHVIAVEPDERMRSVLQARSGAVEVISGRGEAIPLPDESADAVFVSSAWHWMDPDVVVPEVGRVLRDGGRFGVIWTGRDPSIEWLHADQWFAEALAERDSRRAGASEHTDGGPVAPSAEMPVPDCDVIPEHRRVRLPDPALFTNIETELFRFSRYMPVADIVGMLATYSRVITASPELREIGRARAAAAIAEQFPGAAELQVAMRSRCWRADRVSRSDR